jgi:hypothetical protein
MVFILNKTPILVLYLKFDSCVGGKDTEWTTLDLSLLLFSYLFSAAVHSVAYVAKIIIFGNILPVALVKM